MERLQAGDPILRTLVDSLLQRIRGLVASLPADAPMPSEDMPCDDPLERTGLDTIRLETPLRDALASRELEVRYQRIYELAASRVSGYTALVTRDLPDNGPGCPAPFIPL